MALAITGTALSARELRASASKARDAKAARRVLALALVMEGVEGIDHVRGAPNHPQTRGGSERLALQTDEGASRRLRRAATRDQLLFSAAWTPAYGPRAAACRLSPI